MGNAQKLNHYNHLFLRKHCHFYYRILLCYSNVTRQQHKVASTHAKPYRSTHHTKWFVYLFILLWVIFFPIFSAHISSLLLLPMPSPPLLLLLYFPFYVSTCYGFCHQIQSIVWRCSGHLFIIMSPLVSHSHFMRTVNFDCSCVCVSERESVVARLQICGVDRCTTTTYNSRIYYI